MHARAAYLISSLGLVPHPEGGWFREVYRAGSAVHLADERTTRAALTTIYFMLAEGEISRWHRVTSDEVWHYYEGDALELFTAQPPFVQLARHLLGRVGEGLEPVHVVPPNVWQAARPAGAYTLVGCTVGPGFEYADFEMLRDRPLDAALVRKRHPEMARFV
jgi:hypothetical protein